MLLPIMLQPTKELTKHLAPGVFAVYLDCEWVWLLEDNLNQLTGPIQKMQIIIMTRSQWHNQCVSYRCMVTKFRLVSGHFLS